VSDWPQTTLGEICAEGGGFVRTGPFGSQLHQSDYVDDPSAVPVVMPKDMAHGRVDRSSIARVDTETAARLSQHLLAAGDVALSRRGDVGRSAWIGPEDLPILCGTGSMRVHPGAPHSVDPAYLRYFFRSRLAIDYLESQAVGATMPNLNAEIVTGMPVPLLPLERQRLAADVLASIDDMIENNRRRVRALEEMARAIYREWFVHFRYPGHESVSLIDSPLGPIPEGWTVLPSSQVLEVNPRVTLSRGTRCQHLTMGDLDERVMNCEPSGWKDSPTGSKFVNGDTLFARITPCLENGKTGIVQGLEDGEAACGSTEFVVLRGRLVGPSFTYLLARTDDFRGHAIASMSGASGRQRVRNECFDSFLVPTPPEMIAAAFEGVAGLLFRQSWVLHLQGAELATIRDVLLPRLVTGQIDVTDIDLDALAEAPTA
jgi:type I restriction enzyme S subunit